MKRRRRSPPIILSIHRLFSRAGFWIDRLRALPVRWALRGSGRGLVLRRGLRINHPECVSLGDGVHIGEFCWISMLPVNRQTDAPDVALAPHLSVGANTYIGRMATFACMNEVRIGSDVMIADRVFIGDCLHGYSDRRLPIKDQYMFSPGPVSIGDNSWLGVNVSVMPNVKIGRHCVIGANSVVTRDVPDYSVAAGVPAKILDKSDKEPAPR